MLDQPLLTKENIDEVSKMRMQPEEGSYEHDFDMVGAEEGRKDDLKMKTTGMDREKYIQVRILSGNSIPCDFKTGKRITEQ